MAGRHGPAARVDDGGGRRTSPGLADRPAGAGEEGRGGLVDDRIGSRRVVPRWRSSRRAGALLVVLVLLDLGVLAGDALHRYATLQGRFPAFAGWRWDSQLDWSWAEVLGYVQLAAASLVLLVVALRARSLLLGAWSSLLGVVVLDDAAQLHERGGFALARAVGVSEVGGLRGGDVGELVVWAAYGSVLGLLVVLAHRRCADAGLRRASWWLAGGTGLLLLAGAGLDVAHELLAPVLPGRAGYALALAESAGELLAMSLLLVLALVTALTTAPTTALTTALPSGRAGRA
ncbi:hypothetical protein [Pseudokineococcus sp. 1T1Z-3]|uniref:hypothetical protein n=1 Tax=Pseudokineococcus sp. 1T1Z-3 TaxID=3132745 RepID=UPI0030B61D24